jgi:transcription antitermination factor NusG
MTEWYAISVVGGCEGKVQASLAERNYPTFRPLETDWLLVKGQRVETMKPRFPGYVFALMELTDVAEVVSLASVIEVVSCADSSGSERPYPISSSEILAMQIAYRSGDFDLRIDRKPPPYRPKKGDRVKVMNGAYITQIGQVLAPAGKNRIHVKLDNGMKPTLKVTDVAAA